MNSVDSLEIPKVLKSEMHNASSNSHDEDEVNTHPEAPRLTGLHIHGNELVSFCAAVFALLLVFIALTTAMNGVSIWTSNLIVSGVIAGLLILLLVLVIVFARFGAIGEEIVQSRATYVLSDWTIKTLRAAGLPRDITDCLKGILARAATSVPPRNELVVTGRERANDTWLADLEAELGKSRVAEFEPMLLKYTLRQSE